MILSLIPEPMSCIFSKINGVEVAKNREVCTKWKESIDSNEMLIYKIRLTIEFPRQFDIYYKECTFRNDWKNIYIISDQYHVAQKEAPKHQEIILSHSRYEVFDKVATVIEVVCNIFSIGGSIFKITSLGLLASRTVLIKFLLRNPPIGIRDAFLVLKGLPPMTTTFN